MTGYIFTHKGKNFAPEGRADVKDVAAHNAALEADELAVWATKPDRFAAYVNGRIITTWPGASLGIITSHNTYRNNLGARITSVRVRGNNGAHYYGRYGSDWSQLVRLRRCK